LEPNSLRAESNNLDSKLAEIRLSISHHSNKNKVFILLEGTTDIKLFRKFFAKDFTDTTGLIGKEKVIEALEKLISEGYSKIIGIKDADFDHLLSIQPPNNLFITDFHDVEIQMIESSALDSLISEYGNGSIESLKIKESIYRIAFMIGCARYFDEKKKHNGQARDLAFDGLKFNNFIQSDSQQLVFDEERFLVELITESQKRKQSLQLTKQELKSEIESIKSESHDDRQMCSGHDLTKLLGLLFLKNPNSDEIEKALRLSYQLENFRNTNLYSLLYKWAEANETQLFC